MLRVNRLMTPPIRQFDFFKRQLSQTSKGWGGVEKRVGDNLLHHAIRHSQRDMESLGALFKRFDGLQISKLARETNDEGHIPLSMVDSNQSKKSVRELIFERKKELCDFYNQNHPETHKDKDYIFRVVSYAQEQGKMSKKIKLLSPDATLAEAVEAVSVEKLEIHITANDYIDFDGMDSRIEHHGQWRETHPMRTIISIPKKHSEAIIIKLQQHPCIIEVNGCSTRALDSAAEDVDNHYVDWTSGKYR